MNLVPHSYTVKNLPAAIYVWIVPSEEVLDQPGSWRIRKWDTEPFPEANFSLPQAPVTGTTPTERKPSAEASGKPGTEARQLADEIEAGGNAFILDPEKRKVVVAALRGPDGEALELLREVLAWFDHPDTKGAFSMSWIHGGGHCSEEESQSIQAMWDRVRSTATVVDPHAD